MSKQLLTFASGYRIISREILYKIHEDILGFPLLGSKGDLCGALIRAGVRKIEIDKTDLKNTVYNVYDGSANCLTIINHPA